MATYCIINDFNINFKNLKSKIILYQRSISSLNDVLLKLVLVQHNDYTRFEE